MIKAVRDCLAEMAKAGCLKESLHYQEKGRGVNLNPSEHGEAIGIMVDGCLIDDDNIKKCDCLYFYQHSKNSRYTFLVELKGCNYLHALEQLVETNQHPNFALLHKAAQPNKRTIAVAIVRDSLKIPNRPQKDTWEDANKLRLRILPCKEGSSRDLKDIIKDD